MRPRPEAQGPPAGAGRGGGRGTQAPELVPCRVGVAYVSIRVTAQSTARTVVLEVLPLLGRQVRAPRLPRVSVLGEWVVQA